MWRKENKQSNELTPQTQCNVRGQSLVEILPSAIVATASLDNPSSKTEKISKLLVSNNKLQQRLNTELIQLDLRIQVAPSSG